MARLGSILVLVLALFNPAAGFAVVVSAVSNDGPMVQLPGHVLPALATATVDRIKAKAIADDESLTLTIILNRSDPEGFATYLADLYDPASPSFRQFLSPAEVSDRFGPHQDDYDAVKAYFAQRGFTIAEGSTNRMTLTIAAARDRRRRPQGRYWRLCDREPHVLRQRQRP